MNYVEGVERFSELVAGRADWPRPWVFLAGGITDCPDWQQDLRRLLAGGPGTMLNPRRANFPIHDPNAAKEQITWEFLALNQADVFSMWFSDGPSVQPICMYELGRHLARWETKQITSLKVCIGVEPGYSREQDVRIQSALVGNFKIATTLEEHAENILKQMEELVGE